VLDDEARVILKKNNREVPLKLDSLSEADREYLKNWEPGKAMESGVDLGEASGRLYPKTKEEIRDTLRKIRRRDPLNEVSREQQQTINLLNTYRYLCGVPFEVGATPDLVAKANEAAEACRKHGGLSHSIGHYTNKCNLNVGGGILSSVSSYINDGGANNRDARGHRRWCLNPPMEKAAFGGAGKYSAMWCMDSGGKRLKDSWAYPGKGLFPKEYVHGNAWSLYLPGGSPDSSKLKVEVYKLTRRPERAFGMTEEIDGKPLPVAHVSIASNAINFEPDSQTLGRGIYWVRVRGDAVREGYVVELY